MYLFQNKPAEAEQVLKSAFENNPKQFGYLTLLAMHYYGQQRRDEMIAVLNQIKSHAKDFDQAFLTVGDFYLRMGDGDSAIREYKEGHRQGCKEEVDVPEARDRSADAPGQAERSRRTQRADSQRDSQRQRRARTGSHLPARQGRHRPGAGGIAGGGDAGAGQPGFALQPGPGARRARRIRTGAPAVPEGHRNAPGLRPGTPCAGAIAGEPRRVRRRPEDGRSHPGDR